MVYNYIIEPFSDNNLHRDSYISGSSIVSRKSSNNTSIENIGKPTAKRFLSNQRKFNIKYMKIHDKLKKKLSRRISEVTDKHRRFNSPGKLFQKIGGFFPPTTQRPEKSFKKSFIRDAQADLDITLSSKPSTVLKNAFMKFKKQKPTSVTKRSPL